MLLSRWATVGVLVISAALAWLCIDRNVSLLIWSGMGGLMAAFAGPLVLGCLWKGVTRAGAYAGLLTGLVSFVVLHTAWISSTWFEGTVFFGPAVWLEGEAPNPMSCAAVAELLSVLATWLVSLVTHPLPESHLAELFPSRDGDPQPSFTRDSALTQSGVSES